MFDMDPRKDQEADIVGNEAEMFVSGRDIPTDESVPVLHLESRTGPAQASDHLAVKKSQVSQMLAHQAGSPQVMMMVNQIIPQIALARSHQTQGKFAILTETVFERRVTEQWNLCKGVSFKVVLRSQAGR